MKNKYINMELQLKLQKNLNENIICINRFKMSNDDLHFNDLPNLI